MTPVVPAAAPSSILNIVFIHGLDPFNHGADNMSLNTWSCDGKRTGFWPDWLAADEQETAVFTFACNPRVVRLGTDRNLTLPEFATDLHDWLRHTGLADKPLYFVTYSFGGLVVKELVRQFSRDGLPALDIKGIAFIATPHSPRLPEAVMQLLAKLSPGLLANTVKEFSAAYLAKLHSDFSKHRLVAGMWISAFYETAPERGIAVLVPQKLADPQLPHALVRPVEGATHESICKPARTDKLYKDIQAEIRQIRLASLLADSLPGTAHYQLETQQALARRVCRSLRTTAAKQCWIVGRSGSGKTFTARQLSRFLYLAFEERRDRNLRYVYHELAIAGATDVYKQIVDSVRQRLKLLKQPTSQSARLSEVLGFSEKNELRLVLVLNDVENMLISDKRKAALDACLTELETEQACVRVVLTSAVNPLSRNFRQGIRTEALQTSGLFFMRGLSAEDGRRLAFGAAADEAVDDKNLKAYLAQPALLVLRRTGAALTAGSDDFFAALAKRERNNALLAELLAHAVLRIQPEVATEGQDDLTLRYASSVKEAPADSGLFHSTAQGYRLTHRAYVELYPLLPAQRLAAAHLRLASNLKQSKPQQLWERIAAVRHEIRALTLDVDSLELSDQQLRQWMERLNDCSFDRNEQAHGPDSATSYLLGAAWVDLALLVWPGLSGVLLTPGKSSRINGYAHPPQVRTAQAAEAVRLSLDLRAEIFFMLIENLYTPFDNWGLIDRALRAWQYWQRQKQFTAAPWMTAAYRNARAIVEFDLMGSNEHPPALLQPDPQMAPNQANLGIALNRSNLEHSLADDSAYDLTFAAYDRALWQFGKLQGSGRRHYELDIMRVALNRVRTVFLRHGARKALEAQIVDSVPGMRRPLDVILRRRPSNEQAYAALNAAYFALCGRHLEPDGVLGEAEDTVRCALDACQQFGDAWVYYSAVVVEQWKRLLLAEGESLEADAVADAYGYFLEVEDGRGLWTVLYLLAAWRQHRAHADKSTGLAAIQPAIDLINQYEEFSIRKIQRSLEKRHSDRTKRELRREARSKAATLRNFNAELANGFAELSRPAATAESILCSLLYRKDKVAVAAYSKRCAAEAFFRTTVEGVLHLLGAEPALPVDWPRHRSHLDKWFPGLLEEARPGQSWKYPPIMPGFLILKFVPSGWEPGAWARWYDMAVPAGPPS
jgi:hypothetical protein